MQSVGQQLGIGDLEVFRSHPALVCSDAVGVELELEGFTAQDSRTAAAHLAPLWTIVADGSLRNGGVEFITSGGLGGERLHGAYERMVSLLERVNYDASWRCSTHMHINMLDFTVNQVARYMLVYAACEPYLFAHAGAFRRSSNFCTPLGDSLPFHKKLISRMYDDSIAARAGHAVCNKYTALNFMPLFGDGRTRALGTVEFRGGRPMTTMEDLLLQTNLLLAIKVFVRTFVGTEEALLGELQNGILNTVYAAGFAEGLVVAPQDLDDAMIHAWMLLKAYQEGMKTPRPKKGQSFGGDSAESVASLVRAGRSPAQAFAPPEASGHDPAAQGNRDALEAMITARGAWTAAHSTGNHNRYNRGDYNPHDICDWSPQQWPRFYDYCADMQSGRSIKRQVEYAFMAMTDDRFAYRTTQQDASAALLNYMLARDAQNETSPIGTVIRTASERAQWQRSDRGVNRECVMLDRGVREQPRMGSVLDHTCDYTEVLTNTQRDAIGVVVRQDGNDLKNRHIFDFLLHHHTTIKAPVTLRNTLSTGTGIIISANTRIQTVWLYQVLRMAGRTSLQHLTRDALAEFDSVVAVMDILLEMGQSIPVLYTRSASATGQQLHLVSPLRRDCGWMVRSEFLEWRTEARLSPTTGRLVY